MSLKYKKSFTIFAVVILIILSTIFVREYLKRNSIAILKTDFEKEKDLYKQKSILDEIKRLKEDSEFYKKNIEIVKNRIRDIETESKKEIEINALLKDLKSYDLGLTLKYKGMNDILNSIKKLSKNSKYDSILKEYNSRLKRVNLSFQNYQKGELKFLNKEILKDYINIINSKQSKIKKYKIALYVKNRSKNSKISEEELNILVKDRFKNIALSNHYDFIYEEKDLNLNKNILGKFIIYFDETKIKVKHNNKVYEIPNINLEINLITHHNINSNYRKFFFNYHLTDLKGVDFNDLDFTVLKKSFDNIEKMLPPIILYSYSGVYDYFYNYSKEFNLETIFDSYIFNIGKKFSGENYKFYSIRNDAKIRLKTYILDSTFNGIAKIDRGFIQYIALFYTIYKKHRYKNLKEFLKLYFSNEYSLYFKKIFNILFHKDDESLKKSILALFSKKVELKVNMELWEYFFKNYILVKFNKNEVDQINKNVVLNY